jgi:hypothetical protein
MTGVYLRYLDGCYKIGKTSRSGSRPGDILTISTDNYRQKYTQVRRFLSQKFPKNDTGLYVAELMEIVLAFLLGYLDSGSVKKFVKNHKRLVFFGFLAAIAIAGFVLVR